MPLPTMPVTMDPKVWLPSTWRDPREVGRPLTDRAIARYMRMGWYGQAARQHATKGIVVRCACGAVADYNGRQCSVCIARSRAARRRERENDRRFQELLAQKYV